MPPGSPRSRRINSWPNRSSRRRRRAPSPTDIILAAHRRQNHGTLALRQLPAQISSLVALAATYPQQYTSWQRPCNLSIILASQGVDATRPRARFDNPCLAVGGPQEITRYYYKSTYFQIFVATLIVAVRPLLPHNPASPHRLRPHHAPARTRASTTCSAARAETPSRLLWTT